MNTYMATRPTGRRFWGRALALLLPVLLASASSSLAQTTGGPGEAGPLLSQNVWSRNGQPVNVTWSIEDSLVRWLDGQYAVAYSWEYNPRGPDLRRRLWFRWVLGPAFTIMGRVSGVRFQYVPSGGDIRIRGARLGYRVLANASKTLITINTSAPLLESQHFKPENMKATVLHEIGHSLGLAHACGSTLMSPSVTLSPGWSDLLNLQYLYGDVHEPNDTRSNATALTPQSGDSLTAITGASISRRSDTDHYRFEGACGGLLTARVTPGGPASVTVYDGDFSGRVCRNHRVIYPRHARNLRLELLGPSGEVLLAQDANPASHGEAIESFRLPTTGTYSIRITGTRDGVNVKGGGVQYYSLNASFTPPETSCRLVSAPAELQLEAKGGTTLGTTLALTNPHDDSVRYTRAFKPTLSWAVKGQTDLSAIMPELPTPPPIPAVQYGDDSGGDATFSATPGHAWRYLPGSGARGNDVSFPRAGAGTGASVARWTFAAPPGTYRVFATWNPHENRATNSPFTIFDGDTPLATVQVNQELAPDDLHDDGNAWEELGGPYEVKKGSLVLQLTDAADEYVIADGVRIERVGGAVAGAVATGPLVRTLIVDDGDSEFGATGTWTYSAPSGHEGDVRFSAMGTGASVARWSFAVSPGRYRVWATWLPHANRATDSPFTILDGDRPLATVDVDQEQTPDDLAEDGSAWEELGGPYDISGGSLVVQLSDAANEYVIADAIRIERVESVLGLAHAASPWLLRKVDQELRLSQLVGDVVVRDVPLGSGLTDPRGLTWDPGRRVFWTLEGGRRLVPLDPSSPSSPVGQAGQATLRGKYKALAAGPDRLVYLLAEAGDRIDRFDLRTQRLQGPLSLSNTPAGIEGLALASDGRVLWLLHTATSSVYRLDVQSGRQLPSLRAPGLSSALITSGLQDQFFVVDPYRRSLVEVRDPDNGGTVLFDWVRFVPPGDSATLPGEGGPLQLLIDATQLAAGDYVGQIFLRSHGEELRVPVTLKVTAPRGGAVAGDSNGDGVFDQRDLVPVLQAARYMTGEPATLAEGDWNGDGVFNQLDVAHVLQQGTYQGNTPLAAQFPGKSKGEKTGAGSGNR